MPAPTATVVATLTEIVRVKSAENSMTLKKYVTVRAWYRMAC